MKSILRTLALASMVGLGAVAGAQAQTRVYVGVGAPVVAAIPPFPGDGYVWTAGYYDGPVWVPGSWIYRGYDRDAYFGARVDWDHHYVYDRDRRDFDRDSHYRGHDDRDHGRR